MSASLRGYDNSTFGNQLGFNFKFYAAMSYNYLSEAQLNYVRENNRGQGKAITLLKITVGKFNEAKMFADVLGGSIK